MYDLILLSPGPCRDTFHEYIPRSVGVDHDARRVPPASVPSWPSVGGASPCLGTRGFQSRSRRLLPVGSSPCGMLPSESPGLDLDTFSRLCGRGMCLLLWASGGGEKQARLRKARWTAPVVAGKMKGRWCTRPPPRSPTPTNGHPAGAACRGEGHPDLPARFCPDTAMPRGRVCRILTLETPWRFTGLDSGELPSPALDPRFALRHVGCTSRTQDMELDEGTLMARIHGSLGHGSPEANEIQYTCPSKRK